MVETSHQPITTLEDISLKHVLRAMAPSLPAPVESKIQRAFEIARRSHDGVKRISGSPYIVHPLNVAYILAQLDMDDDTICAGLLHDAIEDSDLWLEYIAAALGEDVCRLVDGLTKINTLHVASHQESQMENLRRMLLFTTRDIRVIIIKLADRLHNMRTLHHLRPDKQKRIAEVTLDIYAPMAHLIGMGRIKWELEDLALAHLQPQIYEDIKNAIAVKRIEREALLEDVLRDIQASLAKQEIPAEVVGRAKHFYSIYQKLRRRGTDPRDLHDLLAVRVITDHEKDCYSVLGIVHNLFNPVAGRIKDYIANPKPNGYRSLHTTVRTNGGNDMEVQIRSREMHEIAEQGVAAHWRYKKQGHRTDNQEEHLQLMKQIKRLLKDTEETQNPDEFFNAVRTDLLSDEIFVTTPKGELRRLPKGATPIDFAYQIHTDIGDHFTGAKVDGKYVRHEYKLRTGQRVEVITSPKAHPSPDWLNIAKTARARGKIRRYLLHQQRDKLLSLGRGMLQRELTRARFRPQDIWQSEAMAEICQRYNCEEPDDLFVAIGFGRVSTKQVISRLRPPEQPKHRPSAPSGPADIVSPKKMDDVLYRRARCCNPVPGEPITGIVTVNRGISIHQSECRNIQHFRGNPARLISMQWNNEDSERFDVVIDIGAKDRASLLSDITGRISADGINITNSRTISKGGRASLIFTLEVNDIDQLTRTMLHLETVEGVQSVNRRRRQPAKPPAKRNESRANGKASKQTKKRRG